MPPPAIHRRAPKLAGGGEIVGRHAALADQPAIGLHGEQAGPAPHIGAVVGNVEGQVTEQPHPPLAGALAQGLPLLLELPLQQGLRQQLLFPLPSQVGQDPAVALRQGGGPLPPGSTLVLAAQHHEQAMVAKPGALLAPPASEGLLPAHILGGPVAGQGACDRLRPGRGQGRIQPCCASGGELGVIAGADQAIGEQIIRIDQPGVEGGSARRAVRGTGAIGGGQGEDLPHPHALQAQQVDPGAGGGSEGAAAGGAGKGGGVEQHTAVTVGGTHGVGRV